MDYSLPAPIHDIIQKYVAAGQYSSPEDVLLDALSALRERDEDLAAIAEGIAAMEAGDVLPFEDVVAEIRHRHGFAADA